MNLIKFVKCLFTGHSLECKSNKSRFVIKCKKCGLCLGDVHGYTEVKITIAITEDGKHYEIYGCSVADATERTDRVVESLRGWHSASYTLSHLTVGINTERLKHGEDT